MTETEEKLNKLFEELVPTSGKADTVAGELVRAVERIAYRNWNDGDHIGVGYGKETCNPAARYIMACGSETMCKLVENMWGVEEDDKYDAHVAALELAAVTHITLNPKLRIIPNSEDMWDFRNPEEDRDDWDEDFDEEEE